MNQAFSTLLFEWVNHLSGSSSELVGHNVEPWSRLDQRSSSAELRNFLLVGVESASDPTNQVSLDLLRKYLSPLAWPLDEAQTLYDAGNLVDWSNLDMRNTIVAELVEQAISKDIRPAIVHTESQADYGLFAGTCLSALRQAASSVPGYIRLSPRLLTMSNASDQASIAAEMYGLSKRCRQVFQCLQLGVQEAINPKSAWVEASGLGINALTLAACEPDLLLLYLRNFCERTENVVLSLDLDVLSEAYAPGDHRTTSFGLSLEVLLPALRWIAGEGKLVGIEVTGIGTDMQQAERRPRLAASITQELLSHWF